MTGAPKSMRLVSFRAVGKGAVIGFATIELPIGLKISDCLVLTKDGKTWASFPSKAQIGADGKQVEVNGKKQYNNILQWSDKDTAYRWSDKVVELVRAAHPEAFS